MPRFLSATRYALAPSIDGALYLVSGVGDLHVVVRLAVAGGGVRAIGFTAGRGELVAGQVRATPRGLTVMTVNRRDQPLAIDYEARHLLTAPRLWERRCF